MEGVKLLNDESDEISASHHLPPPMAGYTFVRHVRSALSHDTFLAKAGEEDVIVRVYALDFLRRSEEHRHMVERAVLASRVTTHPHIVRMMEPFATKSDLYVIECCYCGGDLFDAMEAYTRSVDTSGIGHGPRAGSSSSSTGNNSSGNSSGIEYRGLPARVAARILRELMEAVLYLHKDCRLAHRNIKLENIFLDKENAVRLGGLGMCAVLPRSGTNNSSSDGDTAAAAATSTRDATRKDGLLELCCGSKHYAAPEVVRGVPYEGRGVDVWAAGVVLFALLTGAFPFDSDAGDEELFRCICAAERTLEEHPAYKGIGDPLAKDVVRNMLRVDCATRLTVEEVLQHRFMK